jgi:hypothetical protein
MRNDIKRNNVVKNENEIMEVLTTIGRIALLTIKFLLKLMGLIVLFAFFIEKLHMPLYIAVLVCGWIVYKLYNRDID